MTLKYGSNQLWPTIVYKGLLEKETHTKVLDSLFTETNLVNPAGDFQDFDILEDGPQTMKDFKNEVVGVFDQYLRDIGLKLSDFSSYNIRSWITGTRNGYMIPIHNHSGAHLSAVFYFFCEDGNKGGELVAVDPRGNANRGYLDEFKPLFENLVYAPKSGEYVVFPSYLYHHTNVFNGSLRIAMPVDLFLFNEK